MTQQEKQNQKRLDNAAKAASMTLKAQLNALNTDAGFKLKNRNADGSITTYAMSKREHLADDLGLYPHTTKKGKVLGYTPAEFNKAVDDSLKITDSDGKVRAYYIYANRTVKVTVSDDAKGIKEVPLYTSEEADKKVRGESAQSCKLYRKYIIGENQWLPGTIINVLRQSRSIDEQVKMAAKAREKYLKEKAEGLFIVENVAGVLTKVQVNVSDIKDDEK